MGDLRPVDIGVAKVQGAAELIGKPLLRAPDSDAHKYTRGLCAVVGGEMPGAALLSSKAAMRAGAGYVKLLAAQWHPAAPAGLVVDDGPLAHALADDRIKAILAGPGLGRSDDARKRLVEALKGGKPTLLDADALALLQPDMLAEGVGYLATPHDGELEALCRAFSVVAAGRQDRAQALAKASGMVICAKGPDTIIAAPEGRLALAPPASSWLSTAGTGDVLAGIAASRMATGLSPFEAACEAVWLHGEAARQCGSAFTADELADAVTGAIAAAL